MGMGIASQKVKQKIADISNIHIKTKKHSRWTYIIAGPRYYENNSTIQRHEKTNCNIHKEYYNFWLQNNEFRIEAEAINEQKIELIWFWLFGIWTQNNDL